MYNFKDFIKAKLMLIEQNSILVYYTNFFINKLKLNIEILIASENVLVIEFSAKL